MKEKERMEKIWRFALGDSSRHLRETRRCGGGAKACRIDPHDLRKKKGRNIERPKLSVRVLPGHPRKSAPRTLLEKKKRDDEHLPTSEGEGREKPGSRSYLFFGCGDWS